MIDIDIINGTIAEWEAKDLTFVVVERLAWLYIVRDHAIISSNEEKGQDVVTMPSVAISSGSEFMEVCSKADAVKMWRENNRRRRISLESALCFSAEARSSGAAVVNP